MRISLWTDHFLTKANAVVNASSPGENRLNPKTESLGAWPLLGIQELRGLAFYYYLKFLLGDRSSHEKGLHPRKVDI